MLSGISFDDAGRVVNASNNELMAREVGVNDGQFLPSAVRPKGSACCEGAPTASPK